MGRHLQLQMSRHYKEVHEGCSPGPHWLLGEACGRRRLGPGDRWHLLHDASGHEGCSPTLQGMKAAALGSDGITGRASRLLMQESNE